MKIGITGGIGSGKTYVATFLKKKGLIAIQDLFLQWRYGC